MIILRLIVDSAGRERAKSAGVFRDARNLRDEAAFLSIKQMYFKAVYRIIKFDPLK